MTQIQNPIQIYQAKERKSEDITKILHPLVKEWFFSKFKEFSPTQKYGVLSIWERRNILISAPTGGTKTLTAFLSILNYLVMLAEKNELEDKIYAVYTTVAERAKMAKNSPHIFITTPESLAIVLTSQKFVEKLKAVEFCVVDEIHSLENKRGTYLSLTLERLNEISKIWPVKIGLSATIEPLDEVAKYLVGFGTKDEPRDVSVAKVKLDKKIDIKVLSPVKDLIEDTHAQHEMYNLIDSLIQEHKTTLIFTNTRSATERVVSYLKEKFPTAYGDDNIAAHHSSLSKSHRFDIEDRLRQGKLKVVVCSTSLELGIDIGYLDLVIMLGSPKSSARALQRIGRAGHKLHETAKGRFIVLDRDDLVECSVIQKEMIEGKINRIHIPKNCLDVLSQQIFGMAIYKIWDVDELFNLIRRSYCYQELSKSDFLDVISYLSGEYALEKNYVFAKIWYDPITKQVGKKGKMARVLYMTNIGTIPEESFVNVKIAPSGESIGAIDEGFLERMKKGDVFVLGGRKYIYMYTKGMNLYVKNTISRSPTIPSWFSEMLPLSFDSALEIQRFRTLLREKFEKKLNKNEMLEFIRKYLYLEEKSPTDEAIYNYFNEQNHFFGIPTPKELLIERFYDESLDKNYLLFHSMYGRRVNDVLSRAISYLMASGSKKDVEMGINDNGFYLSSDKMNLEKAFNFLNEKNLEDILKEAIEKTDILTRRFRHCATRSLMILRSYKGKSKTVGKQQMKSHFLISAVKKITSEFPILREARREILEDLMDIENAKLVIKQWKQNNIKLKIRDVSAPSPFALNLILQGHSDLIRIEDKQEFLKRMHDLHVKGIEE